MFIFGTRPEAIKMAPLIKEMKKNANHIKTIVTVTAQHRDMLDQVLHALRIIPDYDLNIMIDKQTLTDVTIHSLQGLDKILQESKPDLILVHGDTTTTLAASLAAFYHKIPVGHVEAGLRTGDKYLPYPEEMNRQLTGKLANLHFAPTALAKRNLLKENITEDTIFVTGNTAIDALNITSKKDYKHPVLHRIGDSRLVLVTTHRRENIGKPIESICRALQRLVLKHKDIQVVYPVHLNPKVRKIAYDILGDKDNIHLIEPLDVMEFHNVLARSYIVLTDSGGIQEEAPSLGIPVLVLRDTTERPEGLETGTLKLTGIKEEDIFNITDTLLSNKKEYEKMAKAFNPYGDGEASKRIVQAILYYFKLTSSRPKDWHGN